MELKSGKLRGYQVFDVVGDFTDDAANELRESLRRIEEGKNPKVLVSLYSAHNINSYGISMLIWAWKWAAERDGKLHLIGRPELVSKLKVMNLEHIIQMFASEEDFLKNVFDREEQTLGTRVEMRGKYSVMTIEEDLNILVDAQKLRKDLLAQVDGGHIFLAVDLSKITFLYSEVLGVFISIDKKLKGMAGQLCLLGLSDDLLFSFQNAGLHKALKLSKGREFNHG